MDDGLNFYTVQHEIITTSQRHSLFSNKDTSEDPYTYALLLFTMSDSEDSSFSDRDYDLDSESDGGDFEQRYSHPYSEDCDYGCDCDGCVFRRISDDVDHDE